MSKLTIQIHYPSFIEKPILYFLLRHRKKKYGKPFRRIKLMATDDIDKKYCYALVDPEDYPKLSKYPWQLFETLCKTYYAARLDHGRIVHLHRFITDAPKGVIVDHRNRNGLDNTKQNLRFATRAQNSCNRVRAVKGTSKYRGVYYGKREKKWHAAICFNGKRMHLGYFTDELEAAKAYDAAAKIYHGEFAMLNFPQNCPSTAQNKPCKMGDLGVKIRKIL
jgi:hypothetical protein